MCKEFFKWLNSKIKIYYVNKKLDEITELQNHLNEHAFKIANVHVRALHVLMCNAVKNNDENTFNVACEHLKKYKIPEEIISSGNAMLAFIEDLNKGKYITEFDSNGKIYFKKVEEK
jgi:hypothetical protein